MNDTVDVTAVVPSSGGGGGGGGSGSIIGSTVKLTGVSFPNAKLKLLKDGQVTTSLIANNDGTFSIIVNNLPGGAYQFAIYAEDNTGTTSSSYVVNVLVSGSQVYPFNEIIVPPTLNTNLTTIGQDQHLVMYGYGPAGSTILFSVPGSLDLGSTIADSTGFYQFELANNLPPGSYQVRARAQLGDRQSMYSKPVAITFYTGAIVPPPPTQYKVCVDYNQDGRVNLVDFSILLFWFGKTDMPTRIDCNGDRLIDIKDFSILMYFWTG